MPPWLLKAAVQGITSLVPGAERVNRIFQRATGSLELDDKTLISKFRRCRRHLANYAAQASSPRPSGSGGSPAAGALGRSSGLGPAVMELGTGWFPIAPIGFALCGAEPVYCVDIVSHLGREQVIAALEKFLACADRLEGVVPARLERIERVLGENILDPNQLLAAVGVTNVLADARTLDLGRRVDLIVSNNTLEHIPYDVMRAMFDHFHALLAPGGVMSHWIDMSDHYMNFDASIGPYNFLKFSAPMWRLFNNKHQYQNRLRVSDFRTLHETTRWAILDEQNTAGTPAELRRIRVAPEFRRYREADLLVYETWMVSRQA